MIPLLRLLLNNGQPRQEIVLGTSHAPSLGGVTIKAPASNRLYAERESVSQLLERMRGYGQENSSVASIVSVQSY